MTLEQNIHRALNETEHTLAPLLATRFSEWAELSAEHRRLVLADFETMLQDEYDYGDDLADSFIERENAENGAQEYRDRIGDNIASYARTLAAGEARRQQS